MFYFIVITTNLYELVFRCNFSEFLSGLYGEDWKYVDLKYLTVKFADDTD